jgi:integrase
LWDDVDLASGRVDVKRTLVKAARGEPVFGDPKTPRSRRSIRLSADGVEALRSHRVRQESERQVLGESYSDHGLVFATPRGTPIDPDNMNKYFKADLKRAGLRTVYTFHSLRHSAATMLLAAGVNAKVVADRLGHFSAGFTLDRYVHAVEGLDADAADRLQEFMNKGRRA